MKANHILRLLVAVSLPYALPMLGGQQKPVSERTEATVRGVRAAEPETPATSSLAAQGNQALGSRLVKFSGVLTEFVRNSVSSSVEMTFAVYKDEVGGEALWTETQSVEVDKEGRYTVLLGAAQADGVPVELFPAGEPRWLGVEIRGQARQSRTLLVSVPYALKALDAEKLSGKPLSDFVLSEGLGDQVRRVIEGQNMVASQATSTATAQPGQTKASAATTAAGPMFPPSTFSGTNATQIVSVQQSGSGNGLYAQTASTTGNSVIGNANSPTGSASGVLGVTNSPGGAGVIGVTNAASVGANGVYGKSISTGGNGVFGDATASSGLTHGVLGQTISPNGIGVFGIANATTGFANGVYGQTASPSGDGVFGQNTATSGFANGVVGLSASPDGEGVAGANNAASGFAPGVSGSSASPNGVGVFGNALASSGFAAGVQGLTHSPSGSGASGFGITTGVLGSASATSGFANGVFGQSFSPDGTGVGGFANATSGFALGVSGGTASTNGAGVFGNAIATSGFANGVQGQSSSPNGTGVLGIDGSGQATGVFGHTVIGVGVGGQATAPSGGPAYGVWGDSQSTNGVGVAGYEDATSGFTNGVLGQSVSPNGTGVFGFNNSATGGVGVVGMANATSGFGADGVAGVTASTDASGVSGNAIATSGFTSGVFGQTSSPSGYGVWGAYGFPNSAPNGVGVKGSIESGTQSGIAGQFVNVPGQGLLLQGISGSAFQQVFSVDTSGNLHIAGNLTVDGTKSSTAKLQDGRVVALYAVESPENWFEDFGSTELKNGVAWIPLDGSFIQAANPSVMYHVFLTANGDSNGLYVARKTAAGFEVREHGGGTSNLAFDYRIVARRRGFETLRLAEVHEDSRIVELTRQRLKELANTDVLKRAGAVRTAPTGPRPTIRPVPSRPVVPEVPRPIAPQAPKVNVPQAPKGSVPQPPQSR